MNENDLAWSPETLCLLYVAPHLDPFSRDTPPRVDEIVQECESSFSGGKVNSEHQLWRTENILSPSETRLKQISVQLMCSFFTVWLFIPNFRPFCFSFGSRDLIHFYTTGLAHSTGVNIFSLKSVRIN